jgi:hypothetical protein
MHLADVAHQSVVFVGSSVRDILDAHRTGRIAMIPSYPTVCIPTVAPGSGLRRYSVHELQGAAGRPTALRRR